MKAPLRLITLACAALLAGCATQKELIEKRIAQRSAYFAALPQEAQQRLRDGKVASGDARDAAYIVYGKPDRVYQKVSGGVTNEVWSYAADDPRFDDAPRPVPHSLPPPHRGPWLHDTLWASDLYYFPYEYMRIEFSGGKVLSVESEQH